MPLGVWIIMFLVDLDLFDRRGVDERLRELRLDLAVAVVLLSRERCSRAFASTLQLECSPLVA